MDRSKTEADQDFFRDTRGSSADTLSPIYSQAKPIRNRGRTLDSSNSAPRKLFHLDTTAGPGIQIRGLGLWTLRRRSI